MAQAVREVMSADCECVGENETVLDAAKKLKELNVGSMPICGEDDRLKGMLTDRDIVVKVLAEGSRPALPRPPASSARASRSRSAPTTPSTRRCGRWRSTRCDACRSSTAMISSGSSPGRHRPNVDEEQVGDLVESISS